MSRGFVGRMEPSGCLRKRRRTDSEQTPVLLRRCVVMVTPTLSCRCIRVLELFHFRADELGFRSFTGTHWCRAGALGFAACSTTPREEKRHGEGQQERNKVRRVHDGVVKGKAEVTRTEARGALEDFENAQQLFDNCSTTWRLSSRRKFGIAAVPAHPMISVEALEVFQARRRPLDLSSNLPMNNFKK